MRGSCFLLNVDGMHSETMRLKFSVKPLNGQSVGSHADLTKDMLSSPGEVGSIKDNFIVFETELEGFMPSSLFLS